MHKKLLLLFSALSVAVFLLINNTALACNCGCKGNNCGASQQATIEDITEEKVECPVMRGHWFLPSAAADSTEYNGRTYYFCCGGCKEQFLKNPDQYIDSETRS